MWRSGVEVLLNTKSSMHKVNIKCYNFSTLFHSFYHFFLWGKEKILKHWIFQFSPPNNLLSFVAGTPGSIKQHNHLLQSKSISDGYHKKIFRFHLHNYQTAIAAWLVQLPKIWYHHWRKNAGWYTNNFLSSMSYFPWVNNVYYLSKWYLNTVEKKKILWTLNLD